MTFARSTALISSLTLAGYAVGFAVQILFARAFGAGVDADAWFAAVAVPNFFAVALFASLSKACLPVFVSRHAAVGDRVFRGVSGIVNLTFLCLVLLAVGVTLLAEPIAALLFPAFGVERSALAQDLLAVSIWAVPPVGTALALASLLQGLRRFGLAAASTVLQPIGVLVGLLVFRDSLGITSMAVGLVAGSWLQLLVLLPVLLRGRRYEATFALDDPGMRDVLARLLPLVAAAVLIAIYPLLEKRFASRLPAGEISWLDYGRKPLNLLLFLVAGPAAITSFTAFSESAAAGEMTELRSRAWRAAILILLVLLPVGIFLGFHAESVVRLVFERGEFEVQDTRAAAIALLLLLPLTLFGSAGKVLVHAFLARGRLAVPLMAALLGVLLYTTCGATVADRHGYRGLALLQTGAVGLTIVLTMLALLRDLGLPRGEGIGGSLLGMAAASAACAAVLLLTSGLVPDRSESAFLTLLVLVMLGGMSSMVYLGVLAVTKNRHLRELITGLLARREEGATSSS